jgi:hypothetical protein
MNAQERLRGLLAVGDPAGDVAAGHNAKECSREIYTLWASPDLAASWPNALIADLARQPPPELRGMTRTPRRWRRQILAWHTHRSLQRPHRRPQRPDQEDQAHRRRVPELHPPRLRVLLPAGGCNWARFDT